MRYYVSLWFTPTSQEATIKQVVRASTIDDAISTIMKAHDLVYVHAACAYPVKKRNQDASSDCWRWNVRCSVSGKVSMSVDASAIDLSTNRPNVLYTLG